MDVLEAHAALADHARLGIAQELLLRDLSPGEIAERWHLTTPLVAHHVKVLIAAGLAVRTPSEHDRRRSYLALRHDDPDVVALVGIGAGARETIRPTRVAFVCTRNSARSKIAAALWRRGGGIPVVDAGTSPSAAPHAETLRAAGRRNLDVDPAMHDARTMLRPDDLIIAVCDHAHETWPATSPRWHWSIADPVNDPSPATFDRTCDILAARIDDLRTAITTEDPLLATRSDDAQSTRPRKAPR